jgi:hypothetical protein
MPSTIDAAAVGPVRVDPGVAALLGDLDAATTSSGIRISPPVFRNLSAEKL